MGRVHKKKLAEYAEAAENDDLNKGKSDVEGDDEELEKSSVSSEVQPEAEKKSAVSGNEEEAEDFQSSKEELESDHEKNGGGKKPTKRKNTDKSHKKTQARTAEVEEKLDQDDDEEVDSEDEPLNGSTPAKKGRKAAPAKKPASKGGKGAARGKAKQIEENEADQEEEYEVKEIVDHKVERGVSYFLIRWKGYKKEDDTWEPEDTLSCAELIEKFKKKQPASKTGKKGGAAVKKAGSAKKNTKEDATKEWEVDKIIDYAQEKSGRVFRIRWKGFGPKYDTWEPEENLCCDEIIEKFMKRMKTQENISFKELRVETKTPRRLVNETLPRTNYHNPVGRTSKRTVSKKRIYYGDDNE